MSFQVIQKIKGELIYYIEGESNDKHRTYIIQESNKFFKNDIYIKVFFVRKIKVHNKKRKDFISKVW